MSRARYSFQDIVYDGLPDSFEPSFNIIDDKLVRTNPLSKHYSTTETIITKDMFIACYNAWIKDSNVE